MIRYTFRYIVIIMNEKRWPEGPIYIANGCFQFWAHGVQTTFMAVFILLTYSKVAQCICIEKKTVRNGGKGRVRRQEGKKTPRGEGFMGSQDT